MVSDPKIASDSTPDSATAQATFRALLINQTMATRLVRELKLDQPPHSLSVKDFLEERVRVDEVRNSQLLILRVRLKDPKAATDVATAMATSAVQLNRSVNADEAITLREDLQKEREVALERLQAAQKLLLEYQATSVVEMRKQDAEALLWQRRQYATLGVDIEAEQAKLERAQQEISVREKYLVFERSVIDEPALLESTRPANGSPSGARFSGQYPNPVYQALDQQIATSQTRLAELRSQRKNLSARIGAEGAELGRLPELYSSEVRLAELQANYGLARKVYDDVVLRYEQSRVQMTSASQHLQIVDPAVLPTEPVQRYPGLITLLAALSGLMLVATFVVLRELFRAALDEAPEGA